MSTRILTPEEVTEFMEFAVDHLDPRDDNGEAITKAEASLRAVHDSHEALRAEVARMHSLLDDAPSIEAFDAIAKLCGCAQWDYPGQLVRDVQSLTAERDALRGAAEFDKDQIRRLSGALVVAQEAMEAMNASLAKAQREAKEARSGNSPSAQAMRRAEERELRTLADLDEAVARAEKAEVERDLLQAAAGIRAHNSNAILHDRDTLVRVREVVWDANGALTAERDTLRAIVLAVAQAKAQYEAALAGARKEPSNQDPALALAASIAMERAAIAGDDAIDACVAWEKENR
jgi:YD repeat-containing protein